MEGLILNQLLIGKVVTTIFLFFISELTYDCSAGHALGVCVSNEEKISIPIITNLRCANFTQALLY
jgi:hypothetical protein